MSTIPIEQDVRGLENGIGKETEVQHAFVDYGLVFIIP